MDITLCLTFLAICVPAVLCCNINTCQATLTPFSPTACAEVVKHIDCLKVEFGKCRTDNARNTFMMMLPYSMRMHPPSQCGFDMDHIQKMFTARIGLMNSIMNHTNGIPPPMSFGDDGPFDDSDSLDDDGPFDDGPFDDGPFDDGPFGDGIHPAVFAAGVNPGQTKTTKPPPAPGLLPRFRGGAAMQTEDHKDDNNDSGSTRPTTTTTITVVLYFCVYVLSCYTNVII